MYLFHASSSLSLIGLKITDFQLLPLTEIINKYHFAPMAGEIFAGGTLGFSIENGLALASQGSVNYPLARLLKNYGTYGYKGEQQTTTDVQTLVDDLLKNHFTNLFEFIVRIKRAQQMRKVEALSTLQIEHLFSEVDSKAGVIRQHIISNYLIPVFLVKKCRIDYKQQAWINALFKELIKEIPQDFLEFSLEKQLHWLEAVLCQSQQAVAKSFCISVDDLSALIGIRDDIEHLVEQLSDWQSACLLEDNDWCRITQSPCDMGFIHNCFDGSHMSQSGFWLPPKAILKSVTQLLEYFADKIKMVKNVLEGNDVVVLDEEDRQICSCPFPLVFVSHTALLNESHLIRLTGEYRYHKPMRLGKEISIIATHPAHCAELKAILDMYKVDIPVVDVALLDPKHKATLAFVEKYHVLPRVRLFPYLGFFSNRLTLQQNTALPYQIAATALVLATMSFLVAYCVLQTWALALVFAAISTATVSAKLVTNIDNTTSEQFVTPSLPVVSSSS